MSGRGGWGEGTLTDAGRGKWTYRLPPHLGRRQTTFNAATLGAARKHSRRIHDAALAGRDRPADMPTFDQFCATVLGQHHADALSTKALGWQLKSARDNLGALRLDEIRPHHLTAWRKNLTVSEVTVHSYMGAVMQVLNAAVAWDYLSKSPGRDVKNPQPPPANVTPFTTIDEARAVADELPAAYKALPIFGCMTGLRPEEWVAVERSDIRDGYIHVNKRYVRGVVKQGTKNGTPERRVPLHPLVADVLREHPTRLDTRLLFPAQGGGYLILNNFRPDHWNPAFTAAGIAHRRPKDMRHTFASWQLTGNCNVWHLSKVMGTSVALIERTYGRWIPGSEAIVLGAMDAFVARAKEAK